MVKQQTHKSNIVMHLHLCLEAGLNARALQHACLNRAPGVHLATAVYHLILCCQVLGPMTPS